MKKYSKINELVMSFYSSLDKLAEEYDELTDTDVRESIHMTLIYFFVWGGKNHEFPKSYGMFTLEGDRAVARAVEKFLEAINNSIEVSDIPIGQTRLNLLQNPAIKTPSGRQYDEFIGRVDEPLSQEPLPEYLFIDGDYE